MDTKLVYPIGTTDACRCAAQLLHDRGIALTDHPTPEVTHLLLDVPSFLPGGQLRGGGLLPPILEMLPPKTVVAGGNLEHPALNHHKTMDLLKDPFYLAENAAITADCALRTAAKQLPLTFRRCPTLIIGWGRIGKCLASLLKAMDADVTVAARKEADRAMLQALGFHAADTETLSPLLSKFRLIFNTVPELILSQKALLSCRDCVKVDLASSPGMEGGDVVRAKGLPGLLTPESSGELIAMTFLRISGRD